MSCPELLIRIWVVSGIVILYSLFFKKKFNQEMVLNAFLK